MMYYELYRFVKCFNNSSRLCKRLYYTRIRDIYNQNVTDANFTVKAWIKSVRKMKTKIFVDINDGSSYQHLQVTLNKNIAPKALTAGSSVEVSGTVKTIANNNQLELIAEDIKLIGDCDHGKGYPLAAKIVSPEYAREYATFRPRTDSFAVLLRLRDKIFRKVHEFFDKNHFIFIHTPILTSNDCEGAGEIFKVVPDNEQLIDSMRREDRPLQELDEVFFNNRAYLTVSGQLNLECFARSLSKVYCFGPTFRAENSKSRLHLAEFYMIEAEIAFVNDLEDVCPVVERLIKEVITSMLDEYGADIAYYRKLLDLPAIDVLHTITNNRFQIISYENAARVLCDNSEKFSHPVVVGRPLSKEHEKFLVEYAGNIPIFVVNWPADIKPFYMKSLDGDLTKVAAFDLLFPDVGELCGGSIREDDYNVLENKLKDVKLRDDFEWYLQLRKFGNVRTGGFGLGFERFISILLGTPNIKDTIPFPRWPHNCKF